MHQQPPASIRFFESTEEAIFLNRQNRFVIECLVDGRRQGAYLPNPGRLRELLLPGRKIYLMKSAAGSKLECTVVAVERNGQPVLLHTHMANRVVESLLNRRLLPGFEESIIIKREAVAGHSRFDFLLNRSGSHFLLEVKSCTLFEDSVAMFPDAVTIRGRRHILELADIARRGTPGGVLILINRPDVEWFLPDYHTDLEFARAMLSVRNNVGFTPVSVTWNYDLTLSTSLQKVKVPWLVVEREARDSGSYILILRLESDRKINVGRLGAVYFRRGYYIYVGSAKTGLSKRIDRHLRKRKNLHWHIDWLRNEAEGIRALPVRTSDNIECPVGKAISAISEWSIPGFGCSDCACGSHLFAMDGDPESDEGFISLLQYFRIGRLREIIEDKTNPQPG